MRGGLNLAASSANASAFKTRFRCSAALADSRTESRAPESTRSKKEAEDEEEDEEEEEEEEDDDDDDDDDDGST